MYYFITNVETLKDFTRSLLYPLHPDSRPYPHIFPKVLLADGLGQEYYNNNIIVLYYITLYNII